MRLGKFLSNYVAVSQLQRKPSNILPMIAGTGEGIYYFLDQFIWCCLQPLSDSWGFKACHTQDSTQCAG